MSATQMAAQAEQGPVFARESERKLANSVARSLESKPGKATLRGPDGSAMILPESLFRVLYLAATALAAGQGVSVLPVESELTTQQAASLLHVSRPFVIKQMSLGRLPYRRVGTHRRVKLTDVRAFQERLRAESDAALDELVREARDLGL